MNHQEERIAPRRRWLILALAACALLFLARAGTASRTPITWDEPVYLSASRAYLKWGLLVINKWSHGEFAEPFQKKTINRYWERHSPHPPLAKTINGITSFLFRPLFGKLGSLRAGSALFFAGMLGLVLWHGNRIGGLVCACSAGFALILNPRLFFHAGTANLDTIAAVLGYGTLVYYWKTAADRRIRTTLLAGLLWGLTFSAKNSAFLILPILFLWTLLWGRRLHLFVRLGAMQAVAAVVFFCVWPWLYHDTGKHLQEYWRFAGMERMVQRYVGVATNPTKENVADLTQERNFGGRKFNWSYSLRAIFSVVPSQTILMFVAGTLLALGAWKNGDFGLLLLGAWLPMLLTTLPSTPIYDMERFLLICMPFLSLLAGYAVHRAFHLLRRKMPERATPAVAICAVTLCGSFVPTVREWIYVYPVELSYYNAITGGLPGAVAAGLPRSYWLAGYGGLIPFLNSGIPKQSKIAGDNFNVIQAYKQYRVMMPEVCRGLGSGISKCQYLMLQEPVREEKAKRLQKVTTFSLHDIPIATLYQVTPEYVDHIRQRPTSDKPHRGPAALQRPPK